MAAIHHFHSMSYSEVLRLFLSSDTGLANTEARRRSDIYGPNSLREVKPPTLMRRFFSQFKETMAIILLLAIVTSLFLGEYIDALTILFIVVLNAVLGVVQEFKAERALAALRELTTPRALVVRDGVMDNISSEHLVPGDIVFLEAGSRVPADIRLGEVSALEVEESALTGESLPASKQLKPCATGSMLGDQHCMVFQGTLVTRGRGKGVVVTTGMETHVGRIAATLEQHDGPTPLQNRLSQLGTYLVVACLLVCATVVGMGIWRGQSIKDMVFAGISLAVAAIPEGLPAIVTIVLALGVQRMSRAKALVRRLPAVETLGSATVICSDKTGTLTCNEMVAREVYVFGAGFDLSQKRAPDSISADLSLLCRVVSQCNNARPISRAEKGFAGDPTEVALQNMALKWGGGKVDYHRISEIPFDSNRKLMSVMVRDRHKKHWLFTKGAPDVLLDRCSHYLRNGSIDKLSAKAREEIQVSMSQMASRGRRVIAAAFRPLAVDVLEDEREDSLVFVGLVGLYDPPRPEVPLALRTCMRAGIRVIMITGDHPLTANSIAQEIGLESRGEEAVTGAQLDKLTDEELSAVLSRVNVFARVSPEHKLRIVKLLQRSGHIVAMTGDGVNDAPAIKEADIGVSMGKTGTEVAREASSLVLQDDNFATIVAAISAGRSIYDNIRKFIRYLLACNVGEIFTVFLAMAAGLPLPLRPIQILWVNVVTDGLPALALGVEPPDKDIMQRLPRPAGEGIFSNGLGRRVMLRGILIGLSTVGVFALSYAITTDLARAQTVAFATLVMCQMLHVFDCRSERMGIMEKGFFSNPTLLWALLISFVMFLSSIHIPMVSKFFATVPLRLADWVLVLCASVYPTVLIGLRRVWIFRRRRSV